MVCIKGNKKTSTDVEIFKNVLKGTIQVKTDFTIAVKTVGLHWIYPPASKAIREVAVLTERIICILTSIVVVVQVDDVWGIFNYLQSSLFTSNS